MAGVIERKSEARSPGKAKGTSLRAGIHWSFHALIGFGIFLGLMVGAYVAVESSLFHLKRVQVIPLTEGYPLTAEQVLDLAKVPLGKVSLFSLDLKSVELKLLKNPWVKGVVISKQFPSTLVLKVIERKPVSILNEVSGRIYYVEDQGETFEDKGTPYSKTLPIISGFRASDDQALKRMNEFIANWFGSGVFQELKLSSVSFDLDTGLKALVSFPLKNKQVMRAVLELGQNIDEATLIPKERFKLILSYLYEHSTPASKIWLGDGKKIVVKVSRGS